jgi:hypothetical protein
LATEPGTVTSPARTALSEALLVVVLSDTK